MEKCELGDQTWVRSGARGWSFHIYDPAETALSLAFGSEAKAGAWPWSDPGYFPDGPVGCIMLVKDLTRARIVISGHVACGSGCGLRKARVCQGRGGWCCLGLDQRR